MCTFWAAQSVALIYVGEPLALPLQYTTRAPLVRMTSQLMIQVVWIVILRWHADRARGKSARRVATGIYVASPLAPDCHCLPYHVHSFLPRLCAVY